MDRRKFLRLMGMAGAAAAVPWRFDLRRGFQGNAAWAFAQSPGLSKFAQPLRGVGPGGIPVALPDAAPAPVTGVTHYTLKVAQYTDQLHPALGPTTLRGYSPAVALGEAGYPQRHLGGIIVARKGVPIQLTATNNITEPHILPVDVSANFPDAAHPHGTTTLSVHLHGGHVPWISDGGPMADFGPAAFGGFYGPSIFNGTTNLFKLLNPSLAAGQAEYYYPNDQSARMMWYHDHAHDITRLNAYAGIATAYLIRDTFEDFLKTQGLPDYVENGGREIPLVIQDKVFVNPATIAALDPTWATLPVPQTNGSLWYAHVYDPKRWKLTGNKGGTGAVPDPSVIPEFFGDTMLANGTVYPEATVEARRYRFRILNACQARFLNLQLYVDDGSADSITLNPLTLAPTNPKGPDILQIGTEGGFLPKPVLIPSNVPFNPLTLAGSLIMAPAERADLIIDFSNFIGSKIVLYTDAPAPFPMGDPRNDYFPGAPKNPTITIPGSGPNTRQIMRFNVVSPTSADLPMKFGAGTDFISLASGHGLVWNESLLVPLGVTTPPPGTPVRTLTLNETFDAYGRLIQLLGTSLPPTKVGGGFGRAYMMPSTENPKNGTTEVWQIVNLTGDTHPIHFHLVNVQVIARQPFNVSKYNGGLPAFTGPARGPDPNEVGWKETVRMNPGEVTTVIMQFNAPTVIPVPSPGTPITVPFSFSPNLGVNGFEYVWHCHILEHEEHDMMRPMVVTP